jgi:hydroxyquinol 1,2-dioxygenase
LARFSTTPDPRLRQIMLSLIGHLHAFVKQVQLTEAEWFQAIEILTEAGKMCSDKRQEFILFSDTLGVSMVVDLLDHRKPDGATESTVFGPFHRLGAPDLPMGGNIAHRDHTGTPALVSGRVLDLDGKPVANALLDVWQTQSNGLYDSQDANLDGLHMRGRFRSDAEGRYLIRTVLPVNYPIPSDGPVGAMLKATGGHPWRPAHIHFVVSAEGLRAGHDAYLRPHRPLSAKRCGVRGQGFADLQFRTARGAGCGSQAARRHRAVLHHRVRFPSDASQLGASDRHGRAAAFGRARRPRLRGRI